MQIKIASPQELGLLIRATRKSQKLRLDDVAGSAGVGHVFVREVERGKETVQLGRVMRLLVELGIELKADVPQDVMPVLVALKLRGVKPLKPRRQAPNPGDAEPPAAKQTPQKTKGRK
jgi:transcriptional regulator with XRE-family HTH domain